MKIEAGKYYRTRDGRKVGPLYMRGGEWVSDDIICGMAPMWNIDNGVANFFSSGLESDKPIYDLVAEWDSSVIVHEGKEYDLTQITTPFGLLPEPVQKALKEWEHGVEIFSIGGHWYLAPEPLWGELSTYRAKPAPVEERVGCRRYQTKIGTPVERGTCIKRADGTIDWDTWKGDK